MIDAWLIKKPKGKPTSTVTSGSDPVEVLADGPAETGGGGPSSSSETPRAPAITCSDGATKDWATKKRKVVSEEITTSSKKNTIVSTILL